MKAHVWLEAGYGMVTGCDDPEQAVPLLAEELVDRDGWFLWADDPLECATEALRHADVRVERGRVVPCPHNPDLKWQWWPDMAPDKPGATTAVVFYDPPPRRERTA